MQSGSIFNKYKNKTTGRKEDLRGVFFLWGFLICPICNQKLTDCFVPGRSKQYSYSFLSS